MQQVITSKQARQITGGRTPLVPVQYEAAIQALTECLSIDDAKTWDNKADALAAWAKIYRNDDIGRKAKMLKLHAFRRMGEIAAQLRPQAPKGGKGPLSLLIEQKLSPSNASAAVKLAKATDKVFQQVVNLPRPPSPIVARLMLEKDTAWAALTAVGGSGLPGFAHFCKTRSARELARNLTSDEANRARVLVTAITDWLDEFEQSLRKTRV